MADTKYLYATVLISRVSFPDGEYPSEYEEEIVAIEAGSREEAVHNAIAHGKNSEHTYKNEAGQTIEIRFERLASIQLMDTVEAGSTLYSRSFSSRESYDQLFPPRSEYEVKEQLQPVTAT